MVAGEATGSPRDPSPRPQLSPGIQAHHPSITGAIRKEGEQLTCDLVVIADEAGDVTLGKLPLHAGRGEAGVGAEQLGGCRQDRGEEEEGAAAHGKGEMARNSGPCWTLSPSPWGPAPAPARPRPPTPSCPALTAVLSNRDFRFRRVHRTPAQRQGA